MLARYATGHYLFRLVLKNVSSSWGLTCTGGNALGPWGGRVEGGSGLVGGSEVGDGLAVGSGQ